MWSLSGTGKKIKMYERKSVQMRMAKRSFMLALISIFMVGCGVNSKKADDITTGTSSQEQQQDADRGDGDS